MRVDARTGNYCDWYVFDVKRCTPIRVAVWADDSDHTWGRWIRVTGLYTDEIETVQEDRVSIYPERKLVLFNEIEDTNDNEKESADTGGQLHRSDDVGRAVRPVTV